MTSYPWPANAGPYRRVDNLGPQWISSPVIPRPEDYDQAFETRYPRRRRPHVNRNNVSNNRKPSKKIEKTAKQWLFLFLKGLIGAQ